jgi:hypothetical protein
MRSRRKLCVGLTKCITQLFRFFIIYIYFIIFVDFVTHGGFYIQLRSMDHTCIMLALRILETFARYILIWIQKMNCTMGRRFALQLVIASNFSPMQLIITNCRKAFISYINDDKNLCPWIVYPMKKIVTNIWRHVKQLATMSK